jgi:thioredoxin 1
MARRVHQPLEDQEFDFVLGMVTGPVLVHFCGSWPKAVEACRAVDRLLAEAAEEHGSALTAVRADLTRCPGATRRYGVTGAPTLVLLRDREEVARLSGKPTGEEFRAFLTEHLRDG